MRRLILILFCAFSSLATPALAKDSRAHMWVVSQLSGDARVARSGLQPASLKPNAKLAPGDIVSTGATGRATLTRGADYIVMAPRSELRLPPTPQPNGFTRVMQNLGTMLFKVKHTGVPHFAVDTPMLAAVVKGTTFTVIVDKDRSAVQVIEGAVQVSAIDGGMSRLVQGGRTVFVNHSNPKELIDAEAGTSSPATTSSSAVGVTGSAAPTLTAIAGLTDGLVRPVALPAPTTPGTVVTTVLAPVTTLPPGTAPTVTDPVVDIVDTTLPPATDPVVDVIEDALPAVTDPVVDVVEEALPAVTDPVIDIAEQTLPPVVVPVIDIAVETLPTITEPVVNVVVPVVGLPGPGI